MVKFNPPWKGPPVSIEGKVRRKRGSRVYYHGTENDEILRSIMERGLLPGEWDVEGRIYRHINLVESPEEAEWYTGVGGVVLRVEIPPGVRVKETMFEEGYYVTKPIPPKYISVWKHM